MVAGVLEVNGLTRRFGSVTANDGIGLSVRPGEIVGLLGHNGAGKTTLVSQVVGLLRPDEGSIRVAGVDAVADPAAARRAVALQAQAQAPLDGLTPRSAIEFAARLRGLSRKRAAAAARAIAEELDITEWFEQRATPAGGLSGGIRRLTAFAMAAVAPVPVVILDEPTNDIDAARRRLLWKTVRRLGDEGSGVLLVTHNVVEAERVVDELVILDRGTVVAAGTASQLRGAGDDHLRLELTLASEGADPSVSVDDVPIAVTSRVRAGRRVLLTISAAHAERAVAWAAGLRAAGHVEGYVLAPVTLEDVYLAATGSRTEDDLALETR